MMTDEILVEILQVQLAAWLRLEDVLGTVEFLLRIQNFVHAVWVTERAETGKI